MNAMTTKPFRILGLQQIAIGAPDKGPLRTLWCDIFGLATTSLSNSLNFVRRVGYFNATAFESCAAVKMVVRPM